MKKRIAVLAAFVVIFSVLFYIAAANGQDVFAHNHYDSYTRQALAWHEGKTSLEVEKSSVAYLELAFFEDKIYVSFPPVPSCIEFFLTPFFGQNTPNQMYGYLYCLISGFALTCLFLRKHPPATAVCYGLLCSVGTNFLGIILFGGVWHEAQGLSFMLCSLAVALISSPKKWCWGLSLFFAALAVGCRPFTVLFLPFLLWELYQHIRKDGTAKFQVFKRFSLYLIAPAMVAVSLMAYNYARFGNPLEFGHNYLPEFVNSENGQFSLAYLPQNLTQIFQLPEFIWKNISVLGTKIFVPAGVKFNMYTASAFYLVNPVILVFIVFVFTNCLKSRDKLTDISWLCIFLIFILVTCMHKTLGGCQFGARYFIDMIPYLALYLSKQDLKAGAGAWGICIFSIALNIYGAGLVAEYFL